MGSVSLLGLRMRKNIAEVSKSQRFFDDTNFLSRLARVGQWVFGFPCIFGIFSEPADYFIIISNCIPKKSKIYGGFHSSWNIRIKSEYSEQCFFIFEMLPLDITFMIK